MTQAHYKNIVLLVVAVHCNVRRFVILITLKLQLALQTEIS